MKVGARVLIQRRQEEQGSAPAAPADSDSDDEGADTQVQCVSRILYIWVQSELCRFPTLCVRTLRPDVVVHNS